MTGLRADKLCVSEWLEIEAEKIVKGSDKSASTTVGAAQLEQACDSAFVNDGQVIEPEKFLFNIADAWKACAPLGRIIGNKSEDNLSIQDLRWYSKHYRF